MYGNRWMEERPGLLIRIGTEDAVCRLFMQIAIILGTRRQTDNLFAGNDGGVFSTPNGGTTWNYLITGVTIGQIYKLDRLSSQKSMSLMGSRITGPNTFTPTAGFRPEEARDGMHH